MFSSMAVMEAMEDIAAMEVMEAIATMEVVKAITFELACLLLEQSAIIQYKRTLSIKDLLPLI